MIFEVESCGGIYSMNDKCVVLNAKKMNFDRKLDFLFYLLMLQYMMIRQNSNLQNVFRVQTSL